MRDGADIIVEDIVAASDHGVLLGLNTLDIVLYYTYSYY